MRMPFTEKLCVKRFDFISRCFKHIRIYLLKLVIYLLYLLQSYISCFASHGYPLIADLNFINWFCTFNALLFTLHCCYIATLVLTCFRLTMVCACIWPEIINATFLHLMVLFYKVTINHTLNSLFFGTSLLLFSFTFYSLLPPNY